VAALVADTPAPLIAAGAEVELVSPRGPRRLPLAGFYRGDGVANNVLAPDELLARVHLPPPPPGTRSAYQRLQRRDAIDFPLLSVAATAEVATDGGGTLRALRVVVTALGALPRALKGLDALVAAGRRVDDGALHAEVGALAARQCHPLENVGSAQWRQDVVGAVVRRALAALG
jgi:CO/xanthine dehydrogenase FAD-binding subunit